MFNRYSGFVDNVPFRSKSTMVNMGLTINQKLVDIGNKFSLFLVGESFISAGKSGNVDYKVLTYYSSIQHEKVQYDYGFSVGLQFKYFY